MFLAVGGVTLWPYEDIILTIKLLKAFLSLMRYRPSVEVILICLMSILNLQTNTKRILMGKEQ